MKLSAVVGNPREPSWATIMPQRQARVFEGTTPGKPTRHIPTNVRISRHLTRIDGSQEMEILFSHQPERGTHAFSGFFPAHMFGSLRGS